MSDSLSVDPPAVDPRPDGLRRASSLLLVNTGDGKGKSSSAFGVMTRAEMRNVEHADDRGIAAKRGIDY